MTIENDYDYALLEVEQNIRFSEVAKSIRLIGPQQRVKDGTICLVTGWGHNGTAASSNILLGTETPIINQQVCANAYSHDPFKSTVTERMLCAGLEQGGKSFCKG